MSDSDDQDKTRIQPRKRGVAARRSTKAEHTPSRAETDGQKNPGDATVFTQDGRAAEEPRKAVAQRVRNHLKSTSEQTEAMQQGVAHSSGGKSKNLQAHDILKGRFVLERVLGAGGMGVVYKAKDLLKVEAKDRDPYVAIKVLGEEFKSHPEAFIALQRESRKTQRIAHPNIVNVHDFDKDGDTVFMTMEYLEGTPLDKLIKKYRSTGLPLSDVWQILDGLCSALAYAHDQNIIHSDLKPGNIFVTSTGTAKVFDFGIARAVAKAEQGEVEVDRTVFDAGNLGALTPAYASLEMLEGDPPDVRDDIYALGCIAYQLFTGEHPFDRKNAKEAKRAGMKAARIDDITKNQWKVIEHALAFDREDRIKSVKEFWSSLTKKYSRPYMLWATLTLVIIIGGAVLYDRISRLSLPPASTLSEEDFRVELEIKIRQELIEENLAQLLQNPSFENRWQALIWGEFQDYQALLGETDTRVEAIRLQIYQLYLTEISRNVEAENYSLAGQLIASAKRYTQDTSELDGYLAQIEQSQADQQKLAEAKREQEERERQQRLSAQREQAEAERKRKEYERALGNINEQLRCRALLDMDDLAIAVNTLRKINLDVYKAEEAKIVSGLAQCINKIGRNFPDRAEQYLTAAKGLFDGHSALSSVKVKRKDSCGENLAGLGARGRRTACQDELASGDKGPVMVVIPGRGSMETFAIGRYEVSQDDFNKFCLSTRTCNVQTGGSSLLPVTDLKYQLVQDYLNWLSKETGNRYRLPTMAEWQHAAQAKSQELDANRNCFLDSRGVQKGGVPISTTIGQQNGWGLVNYIGNAGEWVTDGNQLYVVGGSYKTDMSDCNFQWQRAADLNGDADAGIRLVRELTTN